MRKYTKQFDGVELEDFLVPQREIEAAYRSVGYPLLTAMQNAAENITAFHKRQIHPHGPVAGNRACLSGKGSSRSNVWRSMCRRQSRVPLFGSHERNFLIVFFTRKFQLTSVTRSRIEGNVHGLDNNGHVKVEFAEARHAHQLRHPVDFGGT